MLYVFSSYLVSWPREVEGEELDSRQPMKTGAAHCKQENVSDGTDGWSVVCVK